MFDWRRSTIEFIIWMYDSRKVTKSDCPFFGFYIHIWGLRDMGIVKEDGLNDKNQKIWKLTSIGIEIAKRFKEIEEMVTSNV
jgi:hypothetical protein